MTETGIVSPPYRESAAGGKRAGGSDDRSLRSGGAESKHAIGVDESPR